MFNAQTIAWAKFHADQERVAAVVKANPRVVLRCGRRWGKTTLAESAASKWALDGLSVGWFSSSYKLLTPSYKRIYRTVRPAVVSASRLDGIIEIDENENGRSGQIEFWTLNDEDAGRSRSYDRVIIDEASLVPRGLKEIWDQAISPTLLDRRGTAVMAGTPKGINKENFFYRACTDKSLGWIECHAPTAANPTLDQEGVARLQDEYPPLVYQQEFLAEFVDWSGSAFFSLEKLLVNGAGIVYPTICDGVFAVIDTAVKDGKENDGTAVLYCAVSEHFGTPLVLLDYDIVQIQGAMLETWLPGVFSRLSELAVACRARRGVLGTWIEDASAGSILLQQARRRGWNTQALPSELTSAGKDGRAINVSGYVHQGKVKFSHHAYDKTLNFKGSVENHLLTQITGFHIGDKDAARRSDDLLDTFTYAIAISLGDWKGH